LAAPAASLPPDTQTIPAWTIGVLVPNSLVMRFPAKFGAVMTATFLSLNNGSLEYAIKRLKLNKEMTF
jgi:hypothetical protein